MAEVLKGAAVVSAMNEKMKAQVENLRKNNVDTTLAIVRVGDKEDDIAYQRGATKRCETVGVAVKSVELSAEVSTDELVAEVNKLGQDSSVHGILLLRPLPKHIDDAAVCAAIPKEKDVDGVTNESLAGVFSGVKMGYPPCTARAVMEILEFYGIDLCGKNVVVVGRSLVVGKPVAMMLIAKHATVTVCHTRTQNLAQVCKNCDVLVVCAGVRGVVDAGYLRDGQVVIDVGIHVDENGKLCGDVSAEGVPEVKITPVPGGVGTVTTSVLVQHVVESALKV